MFDHKAYFIETLTNTHVGSGDVTLGIVDKEIQKDPVTCLPVFHPSSVKGAIRDHFEPQVASGNFQPSGSARLKPFTFDAVFGDLEMETIQEIEDQLSGKKETKPEDPPPDKMPQEDREKMEKELMLLRKAPGHGLIKFYEARLLTLPLRSDRRVFHHGTSPAVIMDYLNALKDFSVVGVDVTEIDGVISFLTEVQQDMNALESSQFVVFGSSGAPAPIVEEYDNGVVVPLERFKSQAETIGKFLSPRPGPDFLESLAIFKDGIFTEICDNSLPVIARNALDEKGISKNLFYEEILPRRAVLWFMTGTYRFFNSSDKSKYLDAFRFFKEALVSQNIQMGAHASIGYGVTRIQPVSVNGTPERRQPS